MGSLTNIISSLASLVKSDKHGSFLKFCLIANTLLLHLCLKVPGNFETKIHRISGVSTTFQPYLLEKVSHLQKNCKNEANGISSFN